MCFLFLYKNHACKKTGWKTEMVKGKQTQKKINFHNPVLSDKKFSNSDHFCSIPSFLFSGSFEKNEILWKIHLQIFEFVMNF